MTEPLEQLLQQSAATDAAFLLKAKEEAKARMRVDPSQANIAAFQKARDALDRLTSGRGDGGEAAPEPGPVPGFRTLAEVCRFLDGRGWRAPSSTVDRHCKRGLFGANREGVFEERVVLDYARVHLRRRDSGRTAEQEDEDMARERRREELELIREKRLNERIKRERNQGRLIERALLEIELGARAGVLEAFIKGEIQKRVRELVHLVGGSPERAGELLGQLYGVVDTALTDYARTDNFEVVFHDGEG
ncbi:MAG: hypothetical protein AB7D57_03800 [Desulfovibrionaceae bacterium]